MHGIPKTVLRNAARNVAMHISDYAFYYAPGTCGNFIKVIFCYYLDDITSRRMFKLLNDDNGRTHYDDEDHPTYHYLKDVPADKRMITINYDKEDYITRQKEKLSKRYEKVTNHLGMCNG